MTVWKKTNRSWELGRKVHTYLDLDNKPIIDFSPFFIRTPTTVI